MSTKRLQYHFMVFFISILQHMAADIVSIDGQHPTLLTVDTVGGKAYNLYKLGTIGSITVPRWFAVSVDSFKHHLAQHQIFPLIEELDLLCKNPEPNPEQILISAENIRKTIVQMAIDPETAKNILKNYHFLGSVKVAVRSSGVMEDAAMSSCAGLYDSVLNLQRDLDVLDGVKSVWASAFNARIIQERMRLGMSQFQCMMGVVIQEMIEPQASGVISTIVLSNGYPGTQITANFGLGVSVVDGEISPDSWILHATQGYVLDAFCGSKEVQVLSQDSGGLVKVPVSPQMRSTYCLAEQEVEEIGRRVADIRAAYGCEVDIEFALDAQRRLVFLQARPLVAIQSETQVVDLKQGQEPVARGNFSVPGVSSGRLVYISDLDQIASGKIKLSKGDIVLAYVTTNTWSQHLASIGGLITCEGAPSSHPILLCREKGVPCVIGMEATVFKQLLLLDGCLVTLDGHNQAIYQGIVATKPATFADLMERFKPVSIRPYPDLNQILPSLIHNNMVIKADGQYWRKTPTFPIVGFQAEFNLRRFEMVGEILSNPDAKIAARQIDGFICCEMTPFTDHVALLGKMTLEQAAQFNRAQKQCMEEYVAISERFSLDPMTWREYIELSARFRAYILMGGAMRAYSERRVDELGLQSQMPRFYLDQCAQALQSEMDELDTEMHEKIHLLALEMGDHIPVEDVTQLQDKDLFHKIQALANRYRFEHQISLHVPIDLNVAYKRVLREVESIRAGHIFNTHKGEYRGHDVLPHSELKEWLRISIENRLLQSNSHHLDARSKALVRPKILELGKQLVLKGILGQDEEVFGLSADEIANYMKDNE